MESSANWAFLIMQEKVTLFFNEETHHIVAILLTKELGLGYIEPQIIVFSKYPLFQAFSSTTERFESTHVTITVLQKALTDEIKRLSGFENTKSTESFVLYSNNKSIASRNKRILKALGVPDFERRQFTIGKT